MKKFAPVIILFLFAMLLWNVFTPDDASFVWDGDDFDGPLGALMAAMFAGGGLLVAGVVLVFVALLLAFLFAGIGILVVGALSLAAVVVAAVVSPLLLPLLIPIGIFWLFTRRSRKNRANAQTV